MGTPLTFHLSDLRFINIFRTFKAGCLLGIYLAVTLALPRELETSWRLVLVRWVENRTTSKFGEIVMQVDIKKFTRIITKRDEHFGWSDVARLRHRPRFLLCSKRTTNSTNHPII